MRRWRSLRRYNSRCRQVLQPVHRVGDVYYKAAVRAGVGAGLLDGFDSDVHGVSFQSRGREFAIWLTGEVVSQFAQENRSREGRTRQPSPPNSGQRFTAFAGMQRLVVPTR